MSSSAEHFAAQQSYVFHPSALISRGVFRSIENRFIPEEVKLELFVYMAEVQRMSALCQGHLAWYQMDQVVASMEPPFVVARESMEFMYNDLIWKARDSWYQEWADWLSEHHPSYLGKED